MAEVEKLPVLGDPAFWVLYDKLTTSWEEINPFISREGTPLSNTLYKIMQEATLRGAWYEPRPERRWRYPMGMLVLKSSLISGVFENESFWVRAGDVIAKNQDRSRDVFITHSPEHDVPSGHLTTSSHPNLQGIFLPLYTREDIRRIASPRLSKNLRDAQKLMTRRMASEEWTVK